MAPTSCTFKSGDKVEDKDPHFKVIYFYAKGEVTGLRLRGLIIGD